MDRRTFLKTAGIGSAAAMLSPFGGCQFFEKRKPNIIFIMADDLGYGELGCYGQEKIRTPNIDRLAAEGMKFTQLYAGSPVCAPSRCTLLTGKHTGHAYIRGNDEMPERGDVWHDPNLEGQRPLLPNTTTIGTLLQEAGYKTAAIGKWGLGGPGSTGHPNRQGFDLFYGYLCQRVAHNYYPTHLWRNEEKDILEGNEYFLPHQKFPADADPNDPKAYEKYRGKHYSMDYLTKEALNFIQENKDQPFFLYLPYTVPHLALQVPDDSLEEYLGEFPETPYLGNRGYLPQRMPHAAYAAMITRMDRDIGKILALLKKLGLDEDTLIFFTSDNGATFQGIGGADPAFFKSNAPFRGFKQDVYEGGIRVPMVARWKGKIEPRAMTDHIFAFWDVMPTLAELVGMKPPNDIDGISFLPTLLGKNQKQKKHDYLYWEYAGRKQAVRMGNWKGVRLRPSKPIQLYDLSKDIREENDVAQNYPDVVRQIEAIMIEGRTESKLFPLVKE